MREARPADLYEWAISGSELTKVKAVAHWVESARFANFDFDLGVILVFVTKSNPTPVFNPAEISSARLTGLLVDREHFEADWMDTIGDGERQSSLIPLLLGQECSWEQRITITSHTDKRLLGLVAIGGSGVDPAGDPKRLEFFKSQLKSNIERLALSGELSDLDAKHREQSAVMEASSRAVHDFLVQLDTEGEITWASNSLSRIGKDPEKLVGINVRSLFDPLDWENFSAWFSALKSGAPTNSEQFRIQIGNGLADQGFVWVELVGGRFDGASQVGYVLAARDRTERIQFEIELAESEHRYRSIVELAGEGIWHVTWDGETIFANSRLVSMLGLDDTSELQGLRIYDHIDLAHLRALDFGSPDPKNGLRIRSEVELRRVTGDPIWTLLHAEVMVSASGEASLLMMFVDVNDLKQTQRELSRQASHDSLTGLPNRLEIHKQLSVMLGRARRTNSDIGVFFVDLDGFKAVNDNYGHAVGDDLLRQVANRLNSRVRETDFVGRLGGDEFVVISIGTFNDQQSAEMVQRLTKAFDSVFQLSDVSVSVGASIGFAKSSGASDDTDLILDRADIDMYRCKLQRKGNAKHSELKLNLSEGLQKNQFS
ncbi:MAG: sensor domain-containing diguanylate cyclase [Acidimicrobiaceae bacterium]|nr:sensor domain-containing diguanylate cyclase [Acidimicrobiaceae bacterium]